MSALTRNKRFVINLMEFESCTLAEPRRVADHFRDVFLAEIMADLHPDDFERLLVAAAHSSGLRGE